MTSNSKFIYVNALLPIIEFTCLFPQVYLILFVMGKYYYIFTYGCQMNVHESEKIAGALASVGYSACDKVEDASLVAFNTCCIRETAEKKILGHLGDVKKLKEKNKSLIVALLGCMTQQEGTPEKLIKSYPYIDIILGADDIHSLAARVLAAERRVKYFADVSKDAQKTIVEDTPIVRSSGVNAWINIMYGCDNFCAYCIVPFVRGRERSRDFSLIIEEAKGLIASGYKEITLLGQNVDSYSFNKYRFSDILEEIASFDGKFRVRFTTSHPKDFNTKIIDIIAKSPNICKNIHLPVQSGSNRILELMNRKYTRERYLDIVAEIKSKIPNVGLTSDIMTGFPTETEEDFQDTLSLVERARFSTAFTFGYSKRQGTAAAKMPQLEPCVKKKRLTALIDLQNEITRQISAEYLGRTEEILVEDAKKANAVCGRTSSGRLVNFAGKKEEIGSFLNVKIDAVKNAVLSGVRV